MVSDPALAVICALTDRVIVLRRKTRHSFRWLPDRRLTFIRMRPSRLGDYSPAY